MSDAPTDVIYSVTDLERHFPLRGGLLQRKVGSVKAVTGVSLDIKRGKTLGIVGESGSGKSTMARIMALIDEPTSGQLHFTTSDGVTARLDTLRGRSRMDFQRRIQMVFQDPYSVFNPRQRIIDGFHDVLKTYGMTDLNARNRRIIESLEYVNIRPEYLSRFPHEFSGGQRQRMSIARALCPRPELLICDESVSALDVSVQAQVLNLLRSIQQELSITYVFVGHDLSVVRYMSDTVAVMYLGKVMEVLPTEAMSDVAKHPYTRALISAVPSADLDHPSVGQPLVGDIPSPINRPKGCPFSSRCPARREVCDMVDPPLHPLSGSPDHTVACHVANPSR